MATIYTASDSQRRKLEKLQEEFPNEYLLLAKDGYGVSYECRKSLITIRRPRNMSPELKRATAERMKNVRKNKNTLDNLK
jgi:hypothetical protein